MFNNVALDVVIGLVFVYLLYSLLVTIIQEIIANLLSYRAKFLEKAIARMLEEDSTPSKWYSLKILSSNEKTNDSNKKKNNFTTTFYDHPLIKFLGEKPSRSKPSYLVSATFSKVIIDLLRGNKTRAGEETRSKIEATLADGKIKWDCPDDDSQAVEIGKCTNQYLNSIWIDAQGDVERFKELLENWFNETMDRTTGWYKKYVQVISILIGLTIAILFNVDTIEIAHKLEKDPKLREQIIQQADAYIKAHPQLQQVKPPVKSLGDTTGMPVKQKDSMMVLFTTPNADTNYAAIKEKGVQLIKKADSLIDIDLKKTNEILGLGIGSYKWVNCEDCGSGKQIWFFLSSLLGWLITALALSLGAPFWFDLLNKLMKLRSSVAPAAGDNDKQKKDAAAVAKIKRVG